ncbi:MAG: ABC transporter permease subunit [Gammaproteobacteria bacterium]|nr:ABC transporter permease subunit [Gammaproteobacteria bacterium]
MPVFNFNPLTLNKIKRFKSIRRGYYSFIIFTLLVLLSCAAEMLVNSRALVVAYQGQWYFPTYGDIIPGTQLGFEYEYETNYRVLKKRLQGSDSGFVLLPPIPYNPYETDLKNNQFPPFPPSFEDQHYLGTDTIGRDVAARLVYGFRTAIFFSLILLVVSYLIGVSIGAAMGYFGGLFDLLFQRIIEIWSNIPFLYVIMIVSSIMIPNFYTLIAIILVFGWIQMTWYMRTVTYKEKAREYVMAARALGASHKRVIFNHILPNTISIIVTFIPFSIANGIIALTSLDYLGFGLPAPTPSWGELLSQGSNNLESVWIVSSVIVAMTVILVMVTFIGEAIREAFDPKKHTTYE